MTGDISAGVRYLSTATRIITLANIIFYSLLLRIKQETVIVDQVCTLLCMINNTTIYSFITVCW